MKISYLMQFVALAATLVAPVHAVEIGGTSGTGTVVCSNPSTQFGALEFIPAQSDIWLTLNVKNINAAVLNAFPEIDEFPMWLHLIDSVAIGCKSDSSEHAEKIAAQCGYISRKFFLSALGEVGAYLGPVAQSELARPAALYERLTRKKSSIEHHESEIKANSSWGGVFVSLKSRPGCSSLLAVQVETFFDQLLAFLEDEAKRFEMNGWTGFCCTMKGVAKIMDASFGADAEVFVEQMPDEPLYVAYRVKDGNIMVRITPDIENVIDSAPGGDSVLHTEQVQFVGASDNGKALAAYYISPQFLNQSVLVAKSILKEFSSVLELSVKTLASNRPQHQEKMLKALGGINEIHRSLDTLLFPQIGKPATFVAWQGDGDIHLQLETDACGLSFVPTRVRAPKNDGNMVSAAASAYSSSRLPDLDRLIPALESVAEMVQISFDKELVTERTQFAEGRAYASAILNVLNTTGRDLYQSFSGGLSCTWDYSSTWTKMLPNEEDCSLQLEYPVMCFSLNMPLRDRHQFEDSLQELYLVSQGIISLADKRAARQFARELTFTPLHVDENTVLYTNKDDLSYMVDESALTICSDKGCAMNSFNKNEIMKLCGVLVAVDLQPLVEKLKKDVLMRQAEIDYEQSHENEHSWGKYRLEHSQRELEYWSEFMKKIRGAHLGVTTSDGVLRTHVTLYMPCLE